MKIYEVDLLQNRSLLRGIIFSSPRPSSCQELMAHQILNCGPLLFIEREALRARCHNKKTASEANEIE